MDSNMQGEPRSAVLAEALALWSALKPDGAVGPKREDIALSRLRGLAPSIWMMDVVDGGADFRFRIAGERVIAFMGRRYAGHLLSEFRHIAYFDNMHRYFLAAVQARMPISRTPAASNFPGKEFLQMETLLMPLSEDGQTVSGILGAMDYGPRRNP